VRASAPVAGGPGPAAVRVEHGSADVGA